LRGIGRGDVGLEAVQGGDHGDLQCVRSELIWIGNWVSIRRPAIWAGRPQIVGGKPGIETCWICGQRE
jgi:hypothetical protein